MKKRTIWRSGRLPIWLAAVSAAAILATPVWADSFFGNLKKDWDNLTDTVQESIQDITEGKQDVENIADDAKGLKEEFAGPGDDAPRYDPPWVSEIQQRLTALGLNPGPVDGAFGQKTAQAIVIFQKVSDLSPDGKPRPSMMLALRARTQNVQTAQQPQGPVPLLGGQTTLGGQTATAHSTPGFGGQHAFATRKAASFGTAGMRDVEPVMSGGRLVSGYPLTYGDFGGDDTWFGMYERVSTKSALDLALYLDLATLKQWPQIVSVQEAVFDGQDTTFDYETAYHYANRFLTGDLLSRFIAECGPYGCNSNRNNPYHGWAGTNEFESEASYRAFVEQVRPLLIAKAPDLPIRLVQVLEVELQPYDDAAGGFPVRDRRPGTSLLSTTAPVAPKLTINGSYEMPPLAKVPRDEAPEFIAPLQAQKRLAYVAFEVTVDNPVWDYKYDKPTFTATWANPGLYLDPGLQRPHHDFGAASPAVASADPAAESSQGLAGTAAAARTLKIPYLTLLYKYAPDQFDDAYLLALTKRQIGKDQSALIYQGNAGKPHIAVFSEEEYADRVVDFVAPELLPKYKQVFAAYAQKVPGELRYSESLQLGNLVYRDGKLRLKPYGSEESLTLNRPYYLQERDKLALPPLGSREVTNLPAFWGDVAVAGFPDTIAKPEMSNSKISKKSYLALDRVPTIPALAIPSVQAEAFWQAPDCHSDKGHYLSQGFTPNEAEKAAEQCRNIRKQYTGQLRVDYNIAMAGIAVSDNAFVFKANLLGADVFGPNGELVKRYAADDFAIPKNVWQTESDQVAADQQSVEAEASLHIVGVRIGMPLSEADAIVKNSMPVGTVYALDRGKHVLSKSDVDPYERAQIYVSADGTQVISLAIEKTPALSEDEVLGVARTVDFPQKLDADSLVAKLKEVYGEPVFAQKRFMGWGSTARSQGCRSPGNPVGAQRRKNLRLVEGKESDVEMPLVSWYASGSKADNPYEGCGYALVSNYQERSKGAKLWQTLTNHRVYYERYAQLLPEETYAALPQLTASDDAVPAEAASLPVLAAASQSSALAEAPDKSELGVSEPEPQTLQVAKAETGTPDARPASEFTILGSTLGMDRRELLSALAEKFSANEIRAQDNLVFAEKGTCLYAEPASQEIEQEAGSLCALAEVDETSGVQKLVLRQVLPGDLTQQVLDAYSERYGEPVFVDRGTQGGAGERLVAGWGPPVSADRQSLGRGESSNPPTVLEAEIVTVNGVTVAKLLLDPPNVAKPPAKVEITF